MDSTVRYLLIGGAFSAGTSVLWFLWNRFSRSLHSHVFQHAAAVFALSSHSLQQVNNIVTIARILDQLGLRTHTYLWHHDANIDGDDSIMTGYVRLPSKTWLLWWLSVLGISHYIWISHDAGQMVAVGPTGVYPHPPESQWVLCSQRSEL